MPAGRHPRIASSPDLVASARRAHGAPFGGRVCRAGSVREASATWEPLGSWSMITVSAARRFPVSQHMDVVEDEDEGPPPSADGARQAGEHDRRGTDLRLNQCLGHLPDGFLHLVERVDHRRHEQCGIVVGVNEPYPDERPIVLGGPLSEQGRLAVARGGGEQHERGRARFSQARHQSWSPHEVGAKARSRLTRDDPAGARQLGSRVDGRRRFRRSGASRLAAGKGQTPAHWIDLAQRKPTLPVELSGVLRPRAATR